MRLAIFYLSHGVVGIERPSTLAASSLLYMILLLAIVLGTGANGDDGVVEKFPYTAWITHDRTQVRSGPGDDHYPTDELRRGTAVEVYRRVDGGWLAIRPPETSFSWIVQRDIRTTESADVGEVIGTAVVSWIGSNVSEVEDHCWLVKLDRGESVALLGKERRRVVSDGKSDLFYKIAPPAGEFRWLHEDDLVQAKSEVAVIRDPEVELADFRVSLRGSPRNESAEPKQPAVENSESLPRRKDGFSARDKSGSERLALIPQRNASAVTPSGASPDAKTMSSGVDDLESQLRALDARLSLIAAQPADQWDFSELRVAAEQLAGSGQSTLDRARAQLYLDKLAEFEGLKSRHALMAPKGVPEKSSGLFKTWGKESRAKDATDPRFDGTGWLLPVHSSKKNSPPYALLDQDGNILQFVSPAPGLNLNRYVRKEIGVFGQKDQPPTLEKPHLTAHRIVELERHRK